VKHAKRTGRATAIDAEHGSAKRHRGAAGFTLVELMICLMVLAFGLLGIAALQLQALHGGSNGRHLTQAVAVSQNQMENLARTPWTGLPVTAWTTPESVTTAVDFPVPAGGQDYLVSWRIQDVDPGQTRSVDVRVSWNERGKRTRSYTLSSMRYNREGS